jgi:Concanavalin A-like lectin/glucanases superfamily/FlgD Ig-like domain
MFRRTVMLIALALVTAFQSARADITTGLVARYPFDGNANDVSGNNNNGALVGGITLTTDRFGAPNRAYSFNGTNSYVSVPASASLNSPATACTQAAWVYLYGTSLVGSGFDPLIMKSLTTENGFMYRMVANPDYIAAAFNTWDTSQGASQTTPLNQWHHVATVFNGSTLRMYYDGAFIGSQPMAMTIVADNRPLTIGADVPGVLEIFNGKIDDVCIYNRALSDADILQLKNQTTVSAVSGLTPRLTLGRVVPNPASGESRLSFTLASEHVVQIDVFDVAGRRVRALDSGLRARGENWITWDGRMDDGSEVASGVYFLRLKMGSTAVTSRIVRVR